MIATNDGETKPRPHRHGRVFIAAMTSVTINSILFVASLLAPEHSLVERTVNVMTAPADIVVGTIFTDGGNTLSTFLLPLLTIFLCCFVFYTAVIWLVLAVVASVRQALENRGMK